MSQLIAIALGAVTRFLVANGIYAVLGRGFPYGTLFVNVSGSFLMGFLTALLMLQRFVYAAEYRALILIVFFGRLHDLFHLCPGNVLPIRRKQSTKGFFEHLLERSALFW